MKRRSPNDRTIKSYMSIGMELRETIAYPVEETALEEQILRNKKTRLHSISLHYSIDYKRSTFIRLSWICLALFFSSCRLLYAT